MSAGILDRLRGLWRGWYPPRQFKGLCETCGDLTEQGDTMCRPCSKAFSEKYEDFVM